MERESFVFYRSYYIAIKKLPRSRQYEIYAALAQYALEGVEPQELNPISQGFFFAFKPQIDANNKKFEDGKKGGKSGALGGRPPRQQNPIETPKGLFPETPNVNVNVNDNVNDNVNVNDNDNVNENENAEPNGSKISFEEIWTLYDKKVGDKVKLEKKWDALSLATQTEIKQYIPRYVRAIPDKKYRKHFDTFLNNKGWKDEIIKQNSKSNKSFENDYVDVSKF